ncbi:MAG TPA: YbaN family protein [Kofleriaceae bacterium]|nr:YbaN family protein [Kofleriaceae bacterium]
MLQRARRAFYAGLGCVFFGLGVLGAFLPVLPTTPFMLVALWAFSLSSRRLETWLLQHPRFGPRLVAWRAYRAVPLPVKLTAWGSMIGSLTLMTLGGASLLALGGAASVMLIGAIYVARCPSQPPSLASPASPGAPASPASPAPDYGEAGVKQP